MPLEYTENGWAPERSFLGKLKDKATSWKRDRYNANTDVVIDGPQVPGSPAHGPQPLRGPRASALGPHIPQETTFAQPMSFTNPERAARRMEGVHPDLSWAVSQAAQGFPHDVNIQQTGGLRDEATQQRLMDEGATKSLKSRHRKQQTGFGHATDIAIIQDGEISQDPALYEEFYGRAEKAAAERGHTLRWGGKFKSGMQKDYGHIELHTIGQTK